MPPCPKHANPLNSSVLNIIFGIVIGGAVLYLLFARLFRFYRTNEEFVR